MVQEVGQDVSDVLGVLEQVSEQDVEVGRQVRHVHAELPETDVGLKTIIYLIKICNI